jgi:sulfite reductase beta subunit-like hemoprotein
MPADPITTSRPKPNIPRAKRAGLDLDLAAVCAAGPAALAPDDHYRLKTYGVCAQRQDDLFMIRLRVAGGRLTSSQVAVLADAARAHAGGWVHLTTRQNVELHSVRLEDVPDLYARLGPTGLVGRSACGHTIRNVLACPESATSAEEPFDVRPDAVFLSDYLVARSHELNQALPSRINIVLGGCSACGLEALTNDIGLVAVVRDGEPGYQLWAGGSLGTAPRLSVLLRPFLPRADMLAAVTTILDWYCAEGSIDDVAKGRLKFVIEAKGEARFRSAFAKGFAGRRAEAWPAPPAVELAEVDPLALALAQSPTMGWRHGIHPERRAGLASITVRVPLGDLLAVELEAIVALAPDGEVVLTREQNVVIPSVPVADVPAVTSALADMALGPHAPRGALDVRACPGLAFCSLAITASQPVALAVEKALSDRPDLPRDASIAVSGCPNSCAKQQVADVGLAGTKVKVGACIGLGYQLFLGADVPAGLVGEPVLRLLEEEVPDAVVAAIEVWTVLRRPGEHPGRTFRRVGLDAVAAAIEHRLRRPVVPELAVVA